MKLRSSFQSIALLLLSCNLCAQAPAPAPVPVPAPPVQVQPTVQPAQPVVAQPVVAQPVVAQPVVAQPVVAQPVVTPVITADTVAVVADQALTKAQLEALVAKDLENIERELKQKKFEIYQQAVERFVTEGALEAERKTTAFATIQEMIQSVVKDIPEPTAAEIQVFYDQNKARIGDRSFEEIKTQIKEFLLQQAQQKKVETYLEDVKNKFKAQDFLEVPRVQVAATGFSKGTENAPITIVEFADYECGFCSKVLPTVKAVMDKYPGKIKLVYRDFPLEFHPNATPASVAARCAGKQGKFWEMHEMLFANQSALTNENFVKYATQLGLDLAAFDACSKDPSVTEAVQKDLLEGQAAGVSGTPAFFVNGVLLSGAQPESEFVKVIDKELKKIK
jgi:protein-disulfide isomerase